MMVIVTEDSAPMSMDQRVNLSMAVRRYVRAVESFEQASKAFNESCQALRALFGQGKIHRYVVKIDGDFHLVNADTEGNFEVEPIEVV